MIIVKSQDELKSAMRKKDEHIRIVGPYAGELYKSIQKRNRIKSVWTIICVALIVAGISAALFLGATSSSEIQTADAADATLGAIMLTTPEIAIICGTVGIVLLYAIYKGVDIKFSINKDTGEITGELDAKS